MSACRTRGESPPKEPAVAAAEREGDAPEGDADWEAFAPGQAGPEGKLTGEEVRERPAPKKVASRDEALAAVASGNHEGAAAFLAAHLERTPGDEQARVALVHALASVGEYAKAEAAIEGKGKVKPAVAVARLRQAARLRLRRGDSQGAEQRLRNALSVEPGSIAVQGELLDLLVATGRREEPEARQLMDALYDAYDAGKAGDVEGLMAVASAALARGSSGAFHDANMVLGEAEQRSAEDKDPLAFLARDRLLLRRGAVFTEKYAAEEAATTYGLILERDPWHADALAGLATALLGELRIADAARSAEMALQANPRCVEAHAALARVAVIEGRREDARARVEQQIFTVHPEYEAGLAVMSGLAVITEDKAAHAALRARALAQAKDGGRYFTTLADLLVFIHLYPEVNEVLAKAVEVAPKDPLAQSAYGLNLLRLGDEPRGRAALAAAWQRDRFNERTRNVLDLYDNRIDKHFTDAKAKGVRLRLPTEDHEFLEDTTLAAITRARKALDARYGLDPGELRIEMFDDPSEFSIRTIGVPSLGAVGVCFGHLITIVGNHRGTHNLDQVVWHELAHVYAIELSRGRVPRWFTEGLSEWETELADPSWARESAQLLARAGREGKLRKLHELELAFLRAENGLMMEVAYSTAAYAIRYLGETYGHDQLKAMLRGYADGHTTEALFQRHLGKDMATVEREFEAWFQGQLKAKVSGYWPSADDGDEGDPKASSKGDPRDALYRQALVKARAGDFATAERALQGLISKGGDGYRPRMLLAELLARGKDWKAARPHLEKARSFHHESVEPLVKLAELARRERDLAAEAAVLRDALAIEAGAYDPAARLLMITAITGDADGQARALERATAIAPLHPMTLSARAMALAKRDRARAQALLSRALRDLEGGPTDALALAALASAAVGDRDAARRLAGKALEDRSLAPAAREKLEAVRGQ
ncbi:MAG: hypothetical protein KC636_07950 [Myxococcales bacterium]|nr:hypothetical protein [Myxococcales bacterium]